MVIREAQKQLKLRASAIDRYQRQVQKIPTRTKVPQRFLRGTVKAKGKILTPLQKRLQVQKQFGARLALKKREQAKALRLQREQRVYEQKFQSFLRSRPGRLLYAKEFGLKGKPVYAGVNPISVETGKAVSGPIERRMIGFEYKTPYGSVKSYEVEAKRIQSKQKFLRAIEGAKVDVLAIPKAKTDSAKYVLGQGYSSAYTPSFGLRMLDRVAKANYPVKPKTSTTTYSQYPKSSFGLRFLDKLSR